MNAADLLERVHAAGGTATLSGNYVRLTAPRPLPADLMDALKLYKAEIIAYLAGEDEIDENSRESEGATPFEFRLRDRPREWAVYLAPCNLRTAKQSLRDRFGHENVLAVRRKISSTMESTL